MTTQLLQLLQSKHLKLATAESCTGGMIAAAITDVAGSSSVFDRGFVTYSNAAKVGQLGVDPQMIAAHGAVSAEVAEAMARGAIANSLSDLAIAVTGVAGPGGSTVAKPVGLVHFCVATRHGSVTLRKVSFGPLTRADIRQRSVDVAMEMLLACASDQE